MNRRIWEFSAVVGLAWLIIFIICLVVFSAWRPGTPSVFRLLVVSALSVGVFGAIMGGILAALGFFKDEDNTTSNRSPGVGERPRESDLSPVGGLKEGGTYIQEPPELVPLLLHGAEPAQPSTVYIERGKAEADVRAWLRNRQPIAILGAGAPGGIGKTELAIQAANELTVDGTFARRLWIDCGVRTPDDILREMLSQCELSVPPDTDYTDRVAYLKGFFAQKHWLVVLDDVRDVNLAGLEDLLPPSPPCAALVTSRSEQVPALVKLVKVVDLSAMTEDECWRLLRGELRRSIKWSTEKEAIVELIRSCAYNPLALLIAARRIAGYPPNKRWVGLFVGKINASLWSLPISTSDPRSGLFGVFEASYDDLSKEDQRRFRALAAFHPTGFAPEGAAAVWGDDAQAAGEAIDRFRRLSLLNLAQSETERFRLHELLYEYGALKLAGSGNEEVVRAAHATHYAAVLGEANQLFVKGGDHLRLALRLYDAEWPNIQSGQAWAAAHIRDSTAAAEACNWYAWQASINGVRLDAGDRVRWIKSGLAASKKLGNGVAEAAHLSNLGSAYADLGEPRKAIQFYERALVINRATGNRPGEGNALGNLGNAYADLGEPRKAIVFYEERLAIARKTGNRLGEGVALHNLGKAYAVLGDPAKAMEFFEQHLAFARQTGDRLAEGEALGNLGSVYADLGEPGGALQFYEPQLLVVREIGDRRGEGAALGNVGNAYADLGETRKAIQFYEQQLLLVREISDRHGEGMAYGNLASAYADLGETREAIQLYEKQLAIVQEIGDRRGEGAVLGNLGLARAALGETPRAIWFYEQALAIDHRIGDRRAEGAVLGNLGNAFTDLGEPRKAIVFYEQHLAIAREIGDRRGEANALGNMGNAHADLGELQEAISFYEQHLAIAREIGDRRGEGAALGNLGLARAALGESQEAIGFYEQHLAIAREIGDRHDEGNALANMGNAHADLGETGAAIQFYEQALAVDREVGDRRGEAFASWNLGLAYEVQGQFEKASEVMQICVDFEREIGHPDAERDAARIEGLRRRRATPGGRLKLYMGARISRARLAFLVRRGIWPR